MTNCLQPSDGVTLVTGAHGFLGSEIVRILASRGTPVRALVRSSSAPQISGIEYTCGDIRDPAAIAAAMRGVHTVIHSAGLAHTRAPAERFHEVNVTGTENVIQAARSTGISRLVLVSSVSVYGSRPPQLCSEQVSPQPDTPYASSKLHAEELVADAAASGDMSAVILRMATIYGEEDRGNLAQLIRAIIRNRFLPVGDGSNRKTLIYRSDAAEACVRAALATANGCDIYNVGTGSHRMDSIVAAISEHMGKRAPSWHIPGRLAVACAGLLKCVPGLSHPAERLCSRLDKWLAENTYAISKFAAHFELTSHIGLDTGIAREVEWFLQQHAIPSV